VLVSEERLGREKKKSEGTKRAKQTTSGNGTDQRTLRSRKGGLFGTTAAGEIPQNTRKKRSTPARVLSYEAEKRRVVDRKKNAEIFFRE